MRVVVVTPPDDVVTLEEAKAHLRVADASEDDLIRAMVAAATQQIDGPDGWLGRSIGRQTLELRGNLFRSNEVRLPFPPVVEIDAVSYVDPEGAEIALDSSAFELRGATLAVAFGQSWPVAQASAEAVRVQYQAGYTDLPAPIRAAILLMVGDLYMYRETAAAGTMAQVPMSTTVENLLGPYRVFYA